MTPADLGINYQSERLVVVSRENLSKIAFGNSQHGDNELSAGAWCSLVLVIGHKMRVCDSNYSSLMKALLDRRTLIYCSS